MTRGEGRNLDWPISRLLCFNNRLIHGLRLWRCWFSFQQFHTLLQTTPGGHNLMNPTETVKQDCLQQEQLLLMKLSWISLDWKDKSHSGDTHMDLIKLQVFIKPMGRILQIAGSNKASFNSKLCFTKSTLGHIYWWSSSIISNREVWGNMSKWTVLSSFYRLVFTKQKKNRTSDCS